MDNLRSKLIRLAYRNPELRADLLPLLKSAKPSNVPLAPMYNQIAKSLRELPLKFASGSQVLDYTKDPNFTKIKNKVGRAVSTADHDLFVKSSKEFVELYTDVLTVQLNQFGNSSLPMHQDLALQISTGMMQARTLMRSVARL